MLAQLRREEDLVKARLAQVRERLQVAVAVARELPRIERDLEAFNERPPASAPYRVPAADGASELRRKLDQARRERSVRASLRVEEATLMRALERVRARLEHRGIRKIALPLLESVSVAAPCPASWDEMEGDGDVRFCGECQKNVFNLSMMSNEEAEAVLSSAKEGGGACVRFYRRDDGTLLTQDCPVGNRQRRFWRRTAGLAAVGILACIGTMAYAELVSRTCPVQHPYVTQGFN